MGTTSPRETVATRIVARKHETHTDEDDLARVDAWLSRLSDQARATTYQQIMRLLLRRAQPMRRGEHGPAYPRLAGTAMHEAGHALVAVALHQNVRYATCTSGSADGPGGHVAYQMHQQSVFADLARVLAGPVAEMIGDVESECYDGALDAFMAWQDSLEDIDDPHADYGRALQYAGEAYPPAWRWRAIREAWLRVDRWLRAHLPALEAIAERLQRRRKLSGRELYQIAIKHGVRFPDMRLLPRGRSHEDDFWTVQARAMERHQALEVAP